jgi:hypothetical protein
MRLPRFSRWFVLSTLTLATGCGGAQVPESESADPHSEPSPPSDRKTERYKISTSGGETTLFVYSLVERFTDGEWVEVAREPVAGEGYFLIIPGVVGDPQGKTDAAGYVKWPFPLTAEQVNGVQAQSIRSNPWCQLKTAAGGAAQCVIEGPVTFDMQHRSGFIPMLRLIERAFEDPCTQRGLVATDFHSETADCDAQPTQNQDYRHYFCEMQRKVTCTAPSDEPMATVQFATVSGDSRAELDRNGAAKFQSCKLLGSQALEGGSGLMWHAGIAWICRGDADVDDSPD